MSEPDIIGYKHMLTCIYNPFFFPVILFDNNFVFYGIFSRVISSVQRRIVMGDITPLFMQKLQTFYQNRICFPADMRPLKDRCVSKHFNSKGSNASYLDVTFHPCAAVWPSDTGRTSCWCRCWRGRMCRASGRTRARRTSCSKPFLWFCWELNCSSFSPG